MDEERLIEAVRSYPSLWQVSAKCYKDAKAKENAWKKVATEVGEGVSAEDCIKKWKTLRDRFVRELKKVTAKKSGDGAPAYVPTWPLYSVLHFLTDHVKHRPTASNFVSCPPSSSAASEYGDADLESEERHSLTPQQSDSFTSQPPSPVPSASSSDVLLPPAKRKKGKGDEVDDVILGTLKSLQERRRGKDQQQCDEEGHFGQQIAATLRRFTPRQKALAKLQIEQVLFSVEFPPEETFYPPAPMHP